MKWRWKSYYSLASALGLAFFIGWLLTDDTVILVVAGWWAATASWEYLRALNTHQQEYWHKQEEHALKWAEAVHERFTVIEAEVFPLTQHSRNDNVVVTERNRHENHH